MPASLGCDGVAPAPLSVAQLDRALPAAAAYWPELDPQHGHWQPLRPAHPAVGIASGSSATPTHDAMTATS